MQTVALLLYCLHTCWFSCYFSSSTLCSLRQGPEQLIYMCSPTVTFTVLLKWIIYITSSVYIRVDSVFLSFVQHRAHWNPDRSIRACITNTRKSIHKRTVPCRTYSLGQLFNTLYRMQVFSDLYVLEIGGEVGKSWYFGVVV